MKAVFVGLDLIESVACGLGVFVVANLQGEQTSVCQFWLNHYSLQQMFVIISE